MAIALDPSPTVDDLNADLVRLEDAITLLTAELDQARAERDGVAARYGEQRALLDRALRLRADLRRELDQARALAEVRGRLLGDIIDAPAWRRRRPIERAARVERLIATPR